jgi:hypothetical protein
MTARDYQRFRSENAENGNLKTRGQFAKARHWRSFRRVSGALSQNATLSGWGRSADRTRLRANSLLIGNFIGNFAILRLKKSISW